MTEKTKDELRKDLFDKDTLNAALHERLQLKCGEVEDLKSELINTQKALIESQAKTERQRKKADEALRLLHMQGKTNKRCLLSRIFGGR